MLFFSLIGVIPGVFSFVVIVIVVRGFHIFFIYFILRFSSDLWFLHSFIRLFFCLIREISCFFLFIYFLRFSSGLRFLLSFISLLFFSSFEVMLALIRKHTAESRRGL